MKLCETMICWNTKASRQEGLPGHPWVKAGPHPDRTKWSSFYAMSDGAPWIAWRGYSDDERMIRLLLMFTIMVVRDGVPPMEAHKAFLEIDEYRKELPDDMPDTPERIAKVLAWHASLPERDQTQTNG